LVLKRHEFINPASVYFRSGILQFQLQYTEPEAGALTLGSISNEAAAGIKKMTGFNTAGFETVIKQDAVKQIINEHGKTGTIDHSMMDINDIARMRSGILVGFYYSKRIYSSK
jgi:hypothetical protein